MPEIAAGYWWHPHLDTGLGTAGFVAVEGNGKTVANLTQATVATQPDLLTENGQLQYRMRNAANANPSILGNATAFQANWTGPTYIAGWFRLPSGSSGGAGALMQHTTSTGNQSRINFSLGGGPPGFINCAPSQNGTTVVNNQYPTPFADLGWHWCEMFFVGVGATDADRARVAANLADLVRSGGSGTIPSSIFNGTAKVGIGCRFQNNLANVDTTDRSLVVYGDGIPSLNDRIRLRNYRCPVAQDWSLLVP